MSEQEKTTIETIEAAAPAEEVVVPQSTPATEETVAAVEAPKAAAKAEPAQESVDHEDSSDFASAFEKTMTRIHGGQVLEGTVISVVDGEVFVNIGYKSDGVIPVGELSSDSDVKAEELFKEGDKIEVEVTKVNDGEGNVILSRKNVESKKIWDDLMSQENIEDRLFDAVGKEVVKGGLIADISGIRAFVPASQVSTKYIENLSEFVGKPMKLKVLEVDRQRKRIVASQKQVLLSEAAAEKRVKWEALVTGSKVTGIVRRIADFGAFVDIGGIDGLVHVTDAAWGRVKHPSDIFTIGQEIEVIILNVDVEKERVSLGYKQLQPKPWTLAADKYAVGSIVEGKVVRIVPFGAFVALESTIDGLIHISQVSVHRIAKVEDELKVGDVVRCKVLEVNSEAKRISLSRKEALLEEDPELAEQLKAEKAERDRQYAERQEQRQQQRDTTQQAQQTQQTQTREKREYTPRAASSDRSQNSDRGDRRRRSEDGDYELPPVQESKTSLASLFEGLKVDDE
jgi:4-hydroxy-3-methylbut-2-enyl diphosphate reductase